MANTNGDKPHTITNSKTFYQSKKKVFKTIIISGKSEYLQKWQKSLPKKKDRQRNASASEIKNKAESLRNKVIRICENSLRI